MDTNTELVKAGYNQIADTYHAARLTRKAVYDRYFDQLIHFFPTGGRLLDLGCGSGQPVTAYFYNKGFEVVGVDLSESMLAIARRTIPTGQFFVADMVDCTFAPDEFDLILSTFAIIHVPQEKQRLLFQKMHTWLKPGGTAYLVLGFRDEKEVFEDGWYGVRMFWSTFSQAQYQDLFREVGFNLLWSEVETPPNDGTFYTVIVRKD